MKSLVTQLGWMIHRDSQKQLTKTCYENCDRIQKYKVPVPFFFDQSLYYIAEAVTKVNCFFDTHIA